MSPSFCSRPALSSAATLLLLACEPHGPADPGSISELSAAVGAVDLLSAARIEWRLAQDDRRRSHPSDRRGPREAQGAGAVPDVAAVRELLHRCERLRSVEQGRHRREGRMDRGRVLQQDSSSQCPVLHRLQRQDLLNAARRASDPDLSGARVRTRQQALRPALAPSGLSTHRQPKGRDHARPGVPPHVGDHPGGRAPDRLGCGAGRGGLELRAVHGWEGCRLAAERPSLLHAGPAVDLHQGQSVLERGVQPPESRSSGM